MTMVTDGLPFYSVSIADMLNKPFSTVKEDNMKKKLFWVAVLYHKGKNGKDTEIVNGAYEVLALDEAAARKKAIKEIPAKYKDRFDRLEVLVRPF